MDMLANSTNSGVSSPFRHSPASGLRLYPSRASLAVPTRESWTKAFVDLASAKDFRNHAYSASLDLIKQKHLVPTGTSRLSDAIVGAGLVENLRSLFQLNNETALIEPMLLLNIKPQEVITPFKIEKKELKEVLDGADAPEDLLRNEPKRENHEAVVMYTHSRELRELELEKDRLTRRKEQLTVAIGRLPQITTSSRATTPTATVRGAGDSSVVTHHQPDATTVPATTEDDQPNAEEIKEDTASGGISATVSRPSLQSVVDLLIAGDTSPMTASVKKSARELLQTMLFEVSQALNVVEEKLMRLMSDIKFETNERFTIALQRYQEERNTAYEQKSRKRFDDRRLHQLESIISLGEFYEYALQHITDNITKNLSAYPLIVAKLNQQAKVEYDVVPINAPFATGNLAGIYALLLKHFSSPTIVSFFKDFKTALLLKPSGSIQHAISVVDDLAATWDRLHYWNFMTKDIFYTMQLLNALPDTPGDSVRVSTTQHILEHMATLPTDDAKADGGDDAGDLLPIYNHLKEYLHVVVTSNGIKADKPAGGGNNNPATYYRNRGQPPQPVQHAHAATTDTSPTTPRVLTPEGLPIKGTLITVQPQFTDQVFRSRFYLATSRGNVAYHATISTCPRCFGRDKRAQPHVPMCTSVVCKKCALVGHEEALCCQIKPQGHKSALQAALTASKAEKKNT
eukprot:gene25283-30531_t